MYLSVLVKISGSIILVTILVNKIDMQMFLKNIHRVHPGIVLGSFFMYAISVAIGALKWKQFLKDVRLASLLGTCFKAQFYSTILPGQLFGEASKVATLYNKEKNTSQIAASVIADKLTSLISTVIVGFMGLFMSSIILPSSIMWIFIFSCIILISFLFIPRISAVDRIMMLTIEQNYNGEKTFLKKIKNVIESIYSGWKEYVFQRKILLNALLLGAANQMIGVVQIYFIAQALDIIVPFFEYMWMIPMTSFILLLPISFGGLGLRDVSLVGFLGLFSVAGEKGTMVSVIILSSQILSACVGGILVLLRASID